MLNAEKSVIGGKALLILMFLLFSSLLFSQSNTFKLGFTGAYSDFGFGIADFGLIYIKNNLMFW